MFLARGHVVVRQHGITVHLGGVALALRRPLLSWWSRQFWMPERWGTRTGGPFCIHRQFHYLSRSASLGPFVAIQRGRTQDPEPLLAVTIGQASSRVNP